MKKNIIIMLIVILIGILLAAGLGLWISSFFLFEGPTELVIKQECDYEGLRKVTIYEVNGNAVTNGSFHIATSDCNNTELADSEIIFTVSSPNIKETDLNFEWKSFDTLIIKYNLTMEVFKQKTVSESVNPKIIIAYRTE